MIGAGGVVTSASTSTILSLGRPHAKLTRSLPCTTTCTVDSRWRSSMNPSLADCLRVLCRRARSQTLEPLSAGVSASTSVQVRSVFAFELIVSWPKGCSIKSRRVTVGTSGPSRFFFSASSRSLRLRSFSSSFLRFSSALAAFFASLSPPVAPASAPASVDAASAATVPASSLKVSAASHFSGSPAMDGSWAAASTAGIVGPGGTGGMRLSAIHSNGFAGVSWTRAFSSLFRRCWSSC